MSTEQMSRKERKKLLDEIEAKCETVEKEYEQEIKEVVLERIQVELGKYREHNEIEVRKPKVEIEIKAKSSNGSRTGRAVRYIYAGESRLTIREAFAETGLDAGLEKSSSFVRRTLENRMRKASKWYADYNLHLEDSDGTVVDGRKYEALEEGEQGRSSRAS